jgi:hypothetical protein
VITESERLDLTSRDSGRGLQFSPPKFWGCKAEDIRGPRVVSRHCNGDIGFMLLVNVRYHKLAFVWCDVLFSLTTRQNSRFSDEVHGLSGTHALANTPKLTFANALRYILTRWKIRWQFFEVPIRSFLPRSNLFSNYFIVPKFSPACDIFACTTSERLILLTIIHPNPTQIL